MGSCCSPGAYGRVFSERAARLDAWRYRRRGLDGTARRIVEHLGRLGLDGATVLEIGGGVGSLSIELVRAGAERATTVELSPGYERPARRLLRERGVETRVERLLGDVAATPELAPEADDVVMHRVVCCYPDVDALVGVAADRARRSLVLSFPRDAWWTRACFRGVDLVAGLLARGFRTYVRPVDAVLAPALARGFRVSAEHEGLLWRLAALERTPAVASEA